MRLEEVRKEFDLAIEDGLWWNCGVGLDFEGKKAFFSVSVPFDANSNEGAVYCKLVPDIVAEHLVDFGVTAIVLFGVNPPSVAGSSVQSNLFYIEC